jgi:hypothetical protein
MRLIFIVVFYFPCDAQTQRLIELFMGSFSLTSQRLSKESMNLAPPAVHSFFIIFIMVSVSTSLL